jgi:hypothetical protein
MRWIGPSLVVLSLVFSTGGVAIVGQAGSTDTDAQQAAPAAPTEQGTCEPEAGFRRTAPAQPRALKDAPRNKSIVLNTSGYNYLLEGEWRPEPTAKPVGVPDGVLPNPQDAAPSAPPPAAPEAK